MKKHLSNVLAVILVASMAFSMTACGTKEAAPEETAAEVTAETAEAEDAAETTEAADDVSAEEADASSLEDWVNSDLMQSTVQAMSDSSDDMSIALTTDGNKTVTFTFTYAEQLEIAEEDMATYQNFFEEQMAAQESTFTDMRDQIVSETGMDDVVLRIEYLNADGSEVYSTEYTN